MAKEKQVSIVTKKIKQIIGSSTRHIMEKYTNAQSFKVLYKSLSEVSENVTKESGPDSL